MSPLILLLTCFWGGGVARIIDHRNSPSGQQINATEDINLKEDSANVNIETGREKTDLRDDSANVIIETGVLVLEAIDGIHSLRVVDVQQHTINLTWTDFIPIGYNGEYVLAVSTSTDWIRAEWDYKLIGRRPNYTLKNLKAGTTYLLRVAIDSDNYTGLCDLSDIMIARTLPVTHCVHRNITYLVNQYFEHDGEEICCCTGSGDFICEPLVG